MASIISSLRTRSDSARFESVTGRFADVTQTLNGRVSEVIQIERALDDLKVFSENIALAEGRATVVQKSLENIRGVAQSLADTMDLLSTNGTTKDFEAVSNAAREQLGSVVAALNVQFAGRTLFAGDDDNGAALLSANDIRSTMVPFLEGATGATAAFNTMALEFNNTGATFDTTVFLGGAGAAPSSEIARGEFVDYGVKADEAPLRSLLSNLVALGAAFDSSNAIPDAQRRQIAELASTGLRSDVSGIISIESRVGSAEERISTVKSRNIASESSFLIAFNEIAGIDNVEATIKLTEIERQLETAFATTARMSNLSLVNFL